MMTSTDRHSRQSLFLNQGTSMYPANRIVQAMIFLLSLVPVSAIARYEASSLRAASSKSSSSYESGRSTGSRMGFTGPEGTGRPGIYFFKKGENAFERDQYDFAIEMYEVAASWAYKPAQYNLSVMYSKGRAFRLICPGRWPGSRWQPSAESRAT
ncbi:MAG TPA: hypothetical protein VFN25_12840 [Dokdonella sp.]|uniref:hypothetical protein n=1 Tax=Dokdonella sp. TaxID=2291710 RepID=UPI002D7FE7D1|nr:hypothetical protein [Dokdonella sp.]HET9033776.1 hypothetical protein [Dokdonella sp.]